MQLPSKSCFSFDNLPNSSPILNTNSCNSLFFSRRKTASRSSTSSSLSPLCCESDLKGELRKLEEDFVENPQDFSCMIKLLANKINKIHRQDGRVEVVAQHKYIFNYYHILIDAHEKSRQVRIFRREGRGHQSAEGTHSPVWLAGELPLRRGALSTIRWLHLGRALRQ